MQPSYFVLAAGILALAACTEKSEKLSTASGPDQRADSAAVQADLPTPDPRRFDQDMARFEAMNDTTTARVVFTGSSSIRKWTSLPEDLPQLNSANRGFGGSHWSDLYYHRQAVFAGLSPRLVFVYEGDNDLGSGKTVLQTMQTARQFISWFQQAFPEATLVLMAAKPSPKRRSKLEAAQALNAEYAKLATAETRVEYLDVHTPLLTEAGTIDGSLFVADSLHLNDAGYDVWTRTFKTFLGKRAGLNK